MNVETLTVLLADDEPLALRRLRRLTAEVEGVRIVATAADGDQALARARAQIRARDAEQRIGELRAIVQDLRAEGRSAVADFETELWIDGRGGAQRVLVRDLDWIEAERDYVRLHVGARSYLIRDSIRGLVERLDPEAFVRIHRSAVVQRDRVAQLAPRPGGGLTAVLSTGARPAVGRSHAAAVRRLFRRSSGRSRTSEPL